MKIFKVLRGWASKLKRDGVTLWFVCKHPETPWYAKALGLFVVAYALSPIDLIPDFIPVLGYLDDVLLLPGLIWLAIRLTPAEVLTDCRQQGDAWMAQENIKPRSLWGAALVLVVWIGAGWGIWMWLAR
ncbi:MULTISPECIES: YkvA family protein [Polaromonas]|uniref:YkvA family protein n=1 Tax=Polaromonas aquatica TaxID=332657 RepID=A0ABW1TVB2_9BURK